MSTPNRSERERDFWDELAEACRRWRDDPDYVFVSSSGAQFHISATAAGMPRPRATGPKFDFGETIARLKEGKKVAREGWNGKGMYLFLCHLSFAGMSQLGVPPRVWPEISNLLKKDTDPDKAHVAPDIARPFIVMKDAQDKLVVGWLASQTDMLAEDWVEVP